MAHIKGLDSERGPTISTASVYKVEVWLAVEVMGVVPCCSLACKHQQGWKGTGEHRWRAARCCQLEQPVQMQTDQNQQPS